MYKTSDTNQPPTCHNEEMPDESINQDQTIVARVVNGDVDAYGELMERYESKLQRYVVYLIHGEVAARDVVQETFIKAYQNLRGFDPKYKFSSWIYRIAHNEAMNAVKKTKYQSSDDIESLPDESYDARIDEIVDVEFLKKGVRDCVYHLEPKYREVVQLVYFEHMKYDEVSDVLHIPVSTVGVWLSRAKAKLRQICNQKGVKR